MVIVFLHQLFYLNTDCELIRSLNTNGITSENCNVLLLRGLMVEEWLLNQHDYQPFFTDPSLNFEADVENIEIMGYLLAALEM